MADDGSAARPDGQADQDGQLDTRRTAPAAAGRHRRPGQLSPADLDLSAKRAIRALWAAQLISCAGDQFGRVAIAVLIFSTTRSALLTSVAYALTYLPPLLGGPPVVRLAGRFSPRMLMITLDVARAALIAVIALWDMHLWSVFTLLFTAMLLGSPFSAARAALVRDRAASRLARAAGPGSSAGVAGQAQAIGTIGYQAGQAMGFLAGAGLVVALQPRRTLLIDALTFLASAGLVAVRVRRRQAARAAAITPRPLATSASPHAARPTSAGAGAGIVARSTVLRTLALLGWLAGFYVVPECLAAPYARALGGGTLTVGLLMAAMPAGAVVGVLAFSKLIRPPAHEKLLGWLAMLSCIPLIFSVLHPPLAAVLALWALAGLGTAYQLGALVAFIRTLGGPGRDAGGSDAGSSDAGSSDHPGDDDRAGRPISAPADGGRAGALGFAQAGLVAAQCLGFVVAGAAAQLAGPQAAVALAGLCGLAASTALARTWRRAQADRAGTD